MSSKQSKIADRDSGDRAESIYNDIAPPTPKPRLSISRREVPEGNTQLEEPAKEKQDDVKGKDDYFFPADWTTLKSGTVQSLAQRFENTTSPRSDARISPPRRLTSPTSPTEPTTSRDGHVGTRSLQSTLGPQIEIRNPTIAPESNTPKSPAIHGGVTGGIVNFGNVVIGQTSDAHCGNSHCDSERRPPEEARPSEEARHSGENVNCGEHENFIKAVNDSTRNNTNYDIRSCFTHVLQQMCECPIVDCAFANLNYKSKEHVLGASQRQIDVYHAVTLKTVHESINGHMEHHVMLLGGPGEGKSIAAKQYAKLVLEKGVPELKNVELVHYIKGSSLVRNREGKPFELLFSNQLGNCITDSKLNEALESWVAKNPNKVLLVIDGLNDTQYDLESPEDKISLNTSAKSFVLLCNLFRGDIYKGMWILSTSRWEWMWHLPRSVLPARAIELKGFPEHTAHEVLRHFVPSDKRILAKSLMARFPEMQKLCAIPDFLLNIAKILNECECDPNNLSQQAILLKILMYLKNSSPIAARNPNFLHNVAALAYQAAKEGTMEFSHVEAKNLHDTNLNEIEHFLIVKPDPSNFDIAHELVTKSQFRYRFRCKILRDILAALHVITRQKQEWKDIMYKSTASLSNIQLLVFGIVMDKNLANPVTTLAEKDIDFPMKRKHLTKILSNRLTATLTDIQTIHLIVESMGAPVRNPPSEICVQTIDHPREGHDILLAPRYCKHISRLRVESLQIDSTSLDLLDAQTATRYEIHRLVISREISHYELEKLSMLLMNNKDIKEVVLHYYSITYNTETSEVTVHSLKKYDREIIPGLLHHAPDNAKITVKMYKIEGPTRKSAITLESMENLATTYKTEIHFIRIQDTMRTVPGVFIDMLKGTSSCSVGKFLLGATNISGQLISGRKPNQYKLTIHGDLTDSSLIANVIYQGQWKVISTNDFLLTYKEKEALSMKEEYQTTKESYRILCSLTTKLRCSRLTAEGWDFHAQYEDVENNKHAVTKLEIKGLNHSCFLGCLKYLLSCEAKEIILDTYEIVLSRNEDQSLNIRIRYLDAFFLNILKQILKEGAVNEIMVDECEAEEYASLRNILAIASKVKTRIDLLKYTADVFPHMHNILPLCKLTSCKLGRFGPESNLMEIREAKCIKIESTREGNLLAILEKIRSGMSHGTRINVSNITFSGHTNAINEFQKLVCRLLRNDCEIKFGKILLECYFHQMPFEIVHLAAIFRTISIQTTNVQFSLRYGSDGKLEAVEFYEIEMDDFFFFRKRFLWIPKTFVTDLIMSSAENVETNLRSLAEVFEGISACKVEILHSACGIGSIFKRLRRHMDDGKLKSIISSHHGGMTLSRKNEPETFVLHLKKLDVKEYDDMLGSFGDFQPNNIIIEEFEIGENQDVALQQLSGIPSPEMRKFLMENAKLFSDKTLSEHMTRMNKFCEKMPVSITTLRVNGDVSNLDEIIKESKKHSILSVVVENIRIRFSHPDYQANCLTLFSGKFDDIQKVRHLLDDDWMIILDPLEIGDLSQEDVKQNYDHICQLFANDKIKANSIEVSCDLSRVVDEMVALQHCLTPNTITTLDYVLQIRYLPDNVKSVSPHPRVEDGRGHREAMIEFTRRIEGDSRSVFALNNACGSNQSSSEYEIYYEPETTLKTQEDSAYEDVDFPQETIPKLPFTSD